MPKRPVRRHTVVQPPPEAGYRLIPLTKGKNAIVDTGDFDWLNKFNWHATYNNHKNCYYAQGSGPGNYYLSMSRMIAGLDYGDPRIADHRNGDSLDNRRENVRIVTQAQNLMNKRKNKRNKSGFKGVVRYGTRWRAQITVKGQRIILGTFVTREDAAKAYDHGSQIHHGEFGRTNFSNNELIAIPAENKIESQRGLFDA